MRYAPFLARLVIAVVFVLPLAARAQPGGGPPPTVVVDRVTTAMIGPESRYVGHVEAEAAVAVRAQVAGTVTRVHVADGAMVAAGDPLFTIDQAVYRARLAAAEAELARARAEQKNAQAQVAVARADLDRFSKRLAKLEKADPRAVNQSQRDDAESDVAAARARLAAAEAGVGLAEAAVQAGEAAVAAARVELGYTEIRAAISGRIGRIRATVGNYVSPATGVLAEIVQTDPVLVAFPVAEDEAGRLSAALTAGDTPVRLLAGGRDPYPLTGRLAFADNRIDPDTGTLMVWGRVANPDNVLVPGGYLTAVLATAPAREMVVVPQAAVVTTAQGSAVFTVGEDHTVVPRPVQLGPSHGTMIAVSQGLAAGETIIVSGIQKVRPGMAVQTVDAKTAAKATAGGQGGKP